MFFFKFNINVFNFSFMVLLKIIDNIFSNKDYFQILQIFLVAHN